MITEVKTDRQISEVTALAKRIWEEHYTPIIGAAQVSYMLENFQSPEAISHQIRHDGYRYFLVEHDDQAIGYFTCQERDGTLFISKFYIELSYRRRGYGWKCLRFIEKLARSGHSHTLSLTVNRHNLNTLKAYKKLGFVRSGELVQEIGNGYVMDDYLYEKSVITLDILYRDDYFVAVNKPSGLLVHRSMIDRTETEFAMQIVRDQIGAYVYPVHRLDKPTSGVLLFALSSEAAKAISEVFQSGETVKEYLAIVRGYTKEHEVIDYPLKEQHDKMTDSKADKNKPAQSAVTEYKRLTTIELPYPVSRYPQARYSLLSVLPKTGRKHQIRRHMKHIMHPIVGDTKHGRGEHNKLFREKFDVHRLLLSAIRLSFIHPFTQQPEMIEAPLDATMTQLIKTFEWETCLAPELLS